MKLRIVPALAGRGAIVLLGFRPIALTAIQLDKIGVRLRQRGIARERRFVRVDGALDVSAFSQAHPSGHGGACVLTQRGDGGQHGIVESRPARAVAGVRRGGALGVGGAAGRAVGSRQRVVSGAKLRKDRERALEVANGLLMRARAPR